ncbi:cnot10-b, partial [Symbiodinium sp. KB8]
ADGAAPEDTSMHLLLYNQAVALAQQEQHASAASVLESLFRRIEPCDEWVAMRAAFLLLDVYARTFLGTQAEDNNLGLVTQKARAVLQYLEQAHVFTDATATAACIAAAMPASTQGAEAGPLSSYAVAAGRMVVAHFTATLAVHRARLALCTDDVAGCMQHLKVVFDTCAGAGGAAASGDTGSAFSTTLPPADGTDVGGVGAAPRDPTQPGWVQLHCTRQLALSLRAEVAARRRHFTRAVKLLGTCLAESESVARKLGPLNVAGDRGLQVCQYLNNLGALQGRQGNVAAAVLLFTKAVDA